MNHSNLYLFIEEPSSLVQSECWLLTQWQLHSIKLEGFTVFSVGKTTHSKLVIGDINATTLHSKHMVSKNWQIMLASIHYNGISQEATYHSTQIKSLTLKEITYHRPAIKSIVHWIFYIFHPKLDYTMTYTNVPAHQIFKNMKSKVCNIYTE